MNKLHMKGGREGMEIKIKISVNTLIDVNETVKKIREIEKEYNCNCTLLDVTVTH